MVRKAPTNAVESAEYIAVQMPDPLSEAQADAWRAYFRAYCVYASSWLVKGEEKQPPPEPPAWVDIEP